MKKGAVNIDFDVMSIAMRETVLQKAIAFNSTIVYIKEGKLVEENPRTRQTKVLRRAHQA